MRYFISGHLDLTEEEFQIHYAPQLQAAIDEAAEFVVGDARGADAMAQQWLKDRGLEKDLIVFHMFELPRNGIGFKAVGGFTSDRQRDHAMTLNSDADIAWVRPGRKKSGTAKNLTRRGS